MKLREKILELRKSDDPRLNNINMDTKPVNNVDKHVDKLMVQLEKINEAKKLKASEKLNELHNENK